MIVVCLFLTWRCTNLKLVYNQLSPLL